jgi:uncharacterized membrane protein
MNKMHLFALILLCASFASYHYTVDVDRSGTVSVILSMESGDTVNVSLPDDASNFRIVGGSYSIDGKTAIVTSGASGLATFSFTTSLFTTKAGSGWELAFLPPDGAGVQVYAPPYASIGVSSPQPSSVSSDGSRMVIAYQDPGPVSIRYTLDASPPVEAPSGFPMLAVIGAILVIGLAAVFVFVLRKPANPQLRQTSPLPAAAQNQPSLAPSPGKKEMMETFNENDVKIVDFLLGCGGKSRRNELERKTGVSKSSLAMALARLEKRRIIEMDRTSTTHFVKLSDHFLRL